MAKIRPIIPSFSNDGLPPGPMTAAEISDEFSDRMAEFIWSGIGGHWRVCWMGDTEDDGFVAHYGPPVQKEEAERRMEWGMKKYPHLIYWLEKAA